MVSITHMSLLLSGGGGGVCPGAWGRRRLAAPLGCPPYSGASPASPLWASASACPRSRVRGMGHGRHGRGAAVRGSSGKRERLTPRFGCEAMLLCTVLPRSPRRSPLRKQHGKLTWSRHEGWKNRSRTCFHVGGSTNGKFDIAFNGCGRSPGGVWQGISPRCCRDPRRPRPFPFSAVAVLAPRRHAAPRATRRTHGWPPAQ